MKYSIDLEQSKMEAVKQHLVDLKFLFENGNFQGCALHVPKLKVALTLLGVRPPNFFKEHKQETGNDEEINKVYVTREVLEYLTRYSLAVGDEKSFERFMVQLKTYYFDYGPYLPWSAHKEPLLGVYFLYLLAENRIAEFHTELERVPDHNNQYMKYSIDLEQSKMEGRYNSVLQKGETCPQGYFYEQFTQKLMDTARQDIADSLEKAYGSLTMAQAKDLLLIQEVQKFDALVHQREWRVEDMDTLNFTSQNKDVVCIDAVRLITQNLAYANEVERII